VHLEQQAVCLVQLVDLRDAGLGAGHHRAQLEHGERPAAQPDPLLAVDGGARGVQTYYRHQHEEEWRQHDAGDQRGDPLHGLLHRSPGTVQLRPADVQGRDLAHDGGPGPDGGDVEQARGEEQVRVGVLQAPDESPQRGRGQLRRGHHQDHVGRVTSHQCRDAIGAEGHRNTQVEPRRATQEARGNRLLTAR
jgi:hypothetical protein